MTFPRSIEIRACGNPDAFEVWVSCKPFATIRRNGDSWDLWAPGDGAAVIPGDVVLYVARFLKSIE